MGETITLLHVGPEDLEVLLGVEEGVFDNPIVPGQARAFLDDPLHEMVVALDGASVVGMASGQIMYHPDKPPAFFVAEVGVRDAYQRRGIATRLCERLRAIAKARGCEGIWVATEGDNTAARGLYAAMGARQTEDIVVFDWDDRAMDSSG
ncbi:MAG: GNAT family N-acetyltransferase [Pseudomonadota bacterium]